MSDLRSLPSVEQFLQTLDARELIGSYGRPLVLDAVRNALDEARKKFIEGQGIPAEAALLGRVRAQLADWSSPTLLPVIMPLASFCTQTDGRRQRAAVEPCRPSQRVFDLNMT
jgi:hypothetical protein